MARMFMESGSLPTSFPAMKARPSVALMRQQRIRTVVVFPAPFGPKKPKTSPSFTWRLSPSMAVTSPNSLPKPTVSMNSIGFHSRFVDGMTPPTYLRDGEGLNQGLGRRP